MKVIKYIVLTVLGLVTLLLGTIFIWVYIPLYSIQVDELYSEIRKADKIIVKGYEQNRSQRIQKTLYSSSNKKDIIAFAENLVIERPSIFEAGTCACLGGPTIILYKGDEQSIRITNHHENSIRTNFWKSGLNIPILNQEKWVTWFDKRGIPSLKENLENNKKRAIKSKKDEERWVTAMPQVLKRLWSKETAMFGVGDDISEYVQLLNEDIPSKEKRILLLLHWFGSGAGPWSGYPTYESIAEDMLLEYKLEEIVAVSQKKPLSFTEIEGLSRLLAGWSFSKKSPNALEKVSIQLKKQLWNHVKFTDDKDKLRRAERAFNVVELQ